MIAEIRENITEITVMITDAELMFRILYLVSNIFMDIVLQVSQRSSHEEIYPTMRHRFSGL